MADHPSKRTAPALPDLDVGLGCTCTHHKTHVYTSDGITFASTAIDMKLIAERISATEREDESLCITEAPCETE